MGLGKYWNLRIDRHDRVFVITLQKAPENRLNVRFAQEIIRALRDIERELGPDSEGCVITKGNDEKFWCTGLELDESDTNPYANSDGFFPVRFLGTCDLSFDEQYLCRSKVETSECTASNVFGLIYSSCSQHY